MSISHRCLLTGFAAALIIGTALSQPAGPAVAQSAPSGYVNKGLAGVGRLPADMKDKFGETLGSGSGMAVEKCVSQSRLTPAWWAIVAASLISIWPCSNAFGRSASLP